MYGLTAYDSLDTASGIDLEIVYALFVDDK
jgi:hypothetical protein